VQGFEPLVLTGEAAVTGRVDYQYSFARELAKVLRAVVLQAGKGVLQHSRAGGKGRRAT
jgi:hypothetical protein